MEDSASLGLSLESEVAKKLYTMGSRFHQNVPINGLQTDFVLEPSPDRQVVLEIKDWPLTKENVERAAQQVNLLQQATGSDDSYIMLPGKSRFELPKGVITLGDIEVVLDAPQKRGSGQAPPLDFKEHPSFFAAMPFAVAYDDVYYFAMRNAAKEVGGVVDRVDQEKYEGDVVNKIHQMIDTSAAVIADLSESRPNVLYEVGYARGRRLSVVPICSTSLEGLPFDVRNWNVIPYKKGASWRIITTLTERLQAIINESV